MKKIKGMLYKTDGSREPFICDKKESLDKLQEAVGGIIEVVYLLNNLDEEDKNFGNGKDLIINEEGLLLDLPINPFSPYVTFETRWEGEYFRGNILLINGMVD